MRSDDLVGFINCAVGMRPEAVKDAGYLDLDSKFLAEDWDLGVRIRNRGWSFSSTRVCGLITVMPQAIAP